MIATASQDWTASEPRPVVDSRVKCVPPERLADLAPHLQRPLVFTNGVFDILHAGHVSYLEEAATHGHTLIVAVNADASARKLGKRGERPFNVLEDRARVIAGLGCVTWVTWFEESMPTVPLTVLRPDVYVKGGDYRIEQLPEAALMASWGGRVALAPFLAGHSSTDLIEHLRSVPE